MARFLLTLSNKGKKKPIPPYVFCAFGVPEPGIGGALRAPAPLTPSVENLSNNYGNARGDDGLTVYLRSSLHLKIIPTPLLCRQDYP